MNSNIMHVKKPKPFNFLFLYIYRARNGGIARGVSGVV